MAPTTPTRNDSGSEGCRPTLRDSVFGNEDSSRQIEPCRAAAACSLVAIIIGFVNPIAMSLTEVLLGVMVVCWLLAGSLREQWNIIRRNPVALAALALMAFLSLSILYGEAPLSESLRGLAKYRNLVYLTLFITIFRTEKMREAGLRAFAAAMVLTLIASFMAEASIPPFHNHHATLGSDAGIFRNRIIQGLCMSLFAYLMLHRFIEQPRRRWPLAALALLAMGNTMLMVGGRSGYLVLGALIVLLCVQRLRFRTLAYAAAAIGVLGMAGYFHSDTILMRVRLVHTEIAAYLDYRNHGGPLIPEGWEERVTHTSCGQRLEFYRIGLNLFREHPLLGVGVGNIVHHMQAYPEEEGNGPTNHNLHSEFIMMAAQGGVVGLTLLISLLVACWRARRHLSPPMRHVAEGVLVLTIVAGTVNSILTERTEGVLFAFGLGLAFAEFGERLVHKEGSIPRGETAGTAEPPVIEETPPAPLSRAA